MTVLEKQGQHYLLFIVLLVGVYFLTTGNVLSGQRWGISLQTWFWIAVATFSQIYIWIHYYFTELTDIHCIYDNPSKERI